MKKPAKPSFACVVYNRAANGRWSRTREIKTERTADNLWQKLSKGSSEDRK